MLEKAQGSGKDGNSEVRASGIPYELKNGVKKYPYPDFGHEFITALYGGKAFPVSTSRLFWFLGQKCCRCKSKLSQTSMQQEFNGSMIVGEHEIQVYVKADGVTCEHCGQVQLNGNYSNSSSVSEAFVNLFQSLEISP
jgi:hypothetical protein